MYIKDYSKRPKITLNYSGSFFSANNFMCFERFGEYLPVFNADNHMKRMHSIAYYVANMDKTEAFDFNKMSGVCLSAQNYILVEKGTTGFDFEARLFVCSTVKNDDEVVITITESFDESTRAELWESMQMKFKGIKDSFKESVVNRVIPSKSTQDNVSYEVLINKKLNEIKETRFLDINPDDNTHIYLPLEDGRSIRDIRSLKMQGKTGYFTECELESLRELNISDIGLLAYTQASGGRGFSILKAEEFVHDISAEIWLQTRVLYNYPQDAERIKDAYPLLWEELTREAEYWRRIEPMSEKDTLALSPAKLGDSVMWLPCFGEHERLYGVKKNEPFQFTLREKGVSVDFGPTGEYLISSDYGVSFISHAGREYFAVYRTGERRRVRNNIYIRYSFYKLVPMSDVLSARMQDSCENLLRALNWGYYFHTHRYGLVSKPVDDEVFDSLYMAAPVDTEEKKDELDAFFDV
jgi:hypothetical protein